MRLNLLLQVLQQVDHLRLDRDVERRHRLVADDQLGLDGERAGDADALALAAGELVRVAAHVVGVAGRPSRAARPRGPRTAARVFASLWIISASPMIAPTVMRGLSEAYGSWKMICMSRRSARSSSRVERRDVLALEPDLARGRLDQAQDAAAGRRLAAARFADQAQRLARGEVEAHAVDRVHALDLAREACRP